MEIQQRNESRTAALTQYKPPSVESMAVLLAQLKAAYPNQSVTPESAELYLTELASIHRAVGQRRLVAALTAVMRESKFFPTVAELWDHIPPAEPKTDGTLKEMAELKKRRDAHPEEFISWADVCEGLRKQRPDLAAKLGEPNKATLDAQAAELLKGKA